MPRDKRDTQPPNADDTAALEFGRRLRDTQTKSSGLLRELAEAWLELEGRRE